MSGEFNKLKLFVDCPGNYDAWDILPNYREKEATLHVEDPLDVVEIDGESATFRVLLSTDNSKWEMLIRLFRQSRGIEVENNVIWNEKHKLAKVEFQCNILSRKVLCDTSAGFIERETHRNTTWQQARFEVCHHKWVDLPETDGGIALINDSKYGVGLLENTMSLSLLRATVRPDVTSDLGHHEFSYMIYPHGDDFVKAEINNIAYEYNIPLTKADLTCENSFGELYMQTMKMSEKKFGVSNFETEVLGADKPVLVDFWATWCGPCMMLAPTIEEIAHEMEGSVKVCKVNVDEEMELAMQFGITSIPTLVVMKDGQMVNKAIGYAPKKEILKLLGL